MGDIMEEPLVVSAALGGRGANDRIRALVPFSAWTADDQAQLVSPPAFFEAEYSSSYVLRWQATSVVIWNSHGMFK